MSHYGFNVATVSRLDGGAAGALAYIFRGKFHDGYYDKTYDYTHIDDFLYSEVLVPDYAPPEYRDAVTLWKEMERAEKRYDARIGRSVWLSLPNKLELDDWKKLVRDFANEAFVSLGMCVVAAIHFERNPDDPEKNNPNAHLFLSDRPLDRDGFCAKKDRDWNKKKHVRVWRKLWADVQNRVLEQKGLEKVSHESLEVQDKDREPTIPLGRVIMALEKRGIQTVCGDKNREIEIRNREHIERKQRPARERSRDRGRDRSR